MPPIQRLESQYSSCQNFICIVKSQFKQSCREGGGTWYLSFLSCKMGITSIEPTSHTCYDVDTAWEVLNVDM